MRKKDINISIITKRIKYSVSDMVKKYSLPFNRKEKALSSAKKRGISVEEVLQEWDTTTKEACKRGHKAHKFSELFMPLIGL